MSHIYLHDLAYNVDKIISIELDETSIKISMLDDIRHYHNYCKETYEEGIRDYNRLMNDYRDALAKRNSGEEKKELEERYKQLYDFYNNIEIDENKDKSSNSSINENVKKNNNDIYQETLF
jgi:hypothetical protein